jgi:predicted nucleotidyltransferase
MHEHIVRIKDVSRLLDGLDRPYVFVGGATVALYATYPEAAEDVRPTEDVDVVVELVSYAGYAQITERLIELGFTPDAQSSVLCRFKIHGMVVDVMPTEPEAIGFSNRWYPEGFRQAESRRIDEETTVQIFSLPYFLASKWEAFKSRGKANFRASHDFEDIVYVLEQCHDFEQQLANASGEVLEYLHEEIGSVLDNEDFVEGVGCHMQGSYHGSNATEIIDRLKSILQN